MELVLIKTCDIFDQHETNLSSLMLLKQLKFNHTLLSEAWGICVHNSLLVLDFLFWWSISSYDWDDSNETYLAAQSVWNDNSIVV